MAVLGDKEQRKLQEPDNLRKQANDQEGKH